MVSEPKEQTEPAEPQDDDDPLFDVLVTVAGGAEAEARLVYGDGTVDAAIARVLEEEGL